MNSDMDCAVGTSLNVVHQADPAVEMVEHGRAAGALNIPRARRRRRAEQQARTAALFLIVFTLPFVSEPL